MALTGLSADEGAMITVLAAHEAAAGAAEEATAQARLRRRERELAEADEG
jgi:hypothetical protein